MKGIKYVEMYVLSGETLTGAGVLTGADVHILCAKPWIFLTLFTLHEILYSQSGECQNCGLLICEAMYFGR